MVLLAEIIFYQPGEIRATLILGAHRLSMLRYFTYRNKEKADLNYQAKGNPHPSSGHIQEQHHINIC